MEMPEFAMEKQFEGCRLEAYRDQGGVWTIGYGHTGPDVVQGLRWTQAQADAQLLKDRREAFNAVAHLVGDHLSPQEMEALEDFVFNLGEGDFAHSTLLRDIRSGNMGAAANEFEKWDHVAGKVCAGLLARRAAEAALFRKGMQAAGDTAREPGENVARADEAGQGGVDAAD